MASKFKMKDTFGDEIRVSNNPDGSVYVQFIMGQECWDMDLTPKKARMLAKALKCYATRAELPITESTTTPANYHSSWFTDGLFR